MRRLSSGIMIFRLRRRHSLDYRLIKIDTINRDEYRAWHDDIVMDYLVDEDPDENYCN